MLFRSNVALAILAATLVTLPEFTAPAFPQEAERLPLAVGLLVLPGVSHGLIVYFSCLPWLGIGLGGFLLGRVFTRDVRRGMRLATAWGAGLVAAAVLLRWGNGFGNLGVVENQGWSGMLSFVKYGPSLVFVGWNAG